MTGMLAPAPGIPSVVRKGQAGPDLYFWLGFN